MNQAVRLAMAAPFNGQKQRGRGRNTACSSPGCGTPAPSLPCLTSAITRPP